MPREFQILRRLHPWFALAPKPYVLCQDPDVIGAPFYVMERRRGLVLDQELPPGWRADATLHRAIAESLVRVLVDLHAVDWQAAGLGEIARPDGYLHRQVSGWMDRLQRSRTNEPSEAETKLFAWLPAALPASPTSTVIHNDYKLNNVLLDFGNPTRITAVLDWEMATVGDPLSDLASLLVYWTEPGEAALMGGLKSVTETAGWPSRGEIRHLYARLSGRDLSALGWYLAFAYFKVGVICQQIYFRWRNGQTHDERFAGHGVVARNLIDRAAREAGLS
jgi:aminoglycoside phosphotransferase (APT) family kinase protein